mgnify:CR=1 FL=1
MPIEKDKVVTLHYTLIDAAASEPEAGPLTTQQADIDANFGGEALSDVLNALKYSDSEFAAGALKKLSRNSPIAMGAALEIIHRVRNRDDIRFALDQEYRFTFRAMEDGDFLEGIRAQIIDKDRNPQWKYSLDTLPAGKVTKMLLPLGADALTFEKGE